MGEGCVRTDVVGLSVRGGTVAFTLREGILREAFEQRARIRLWFQQDLMCV